MKKSKRKVNRARTAQDRAFLDSGMFRNKVERDRTKFTRKKKHKHHD